MHPLRCFLFGSILISTLGVSSAAHADAAPSCSQFDSDITCSASDVGQPCSGGGTCYQVFCEADPSGLCGVNLYKCETCPTVLDADAGADGGSGCSSSSDWGESCAGGRGFCSKPPEWCPPIPDALFKSGSQLCLDFSPQTSIAHTDAGGTDASWDGGGCGSSSQAGAPDAAADAAGPDAASHAGEGTSRADGGMMGAGSSPKSNGDSPSASGGGCSTSPDRNRGWFAAGLGLAGLVGLGLGRRRRSRT